MYSSYKLNKQGDNIQPWPTPFPTWNQYVFLCLVLTAASWPAYRFLKRQVRWSGIPISFRIFQFVVIHTVKGFGIVNKAEVDVFLELCCFFDDPVDVGNLISGSSVLSKSSLNIWKFTVHILLKPGLENFEHYFASVWDECNCAVVWAFVGTALLWDWNEIRLFPVLWPLLSFPNLLPYWVWPFHSIIFQDLKQLKWNSTTSTSFVRSDATWLHIPGHLALGESMHSPWSSPGQNTGVGSLSLLLGMFPTQGLSPSLLHCRRILY